jgi:hypothetical protein
MRNRQRRERGTIPPETMVIDNASQTFMRLVRL